MKNQPAQPAFVLSGKWQHQLISLWNLWWSTLVVVLRRLLRGPRFPNWTWALETTTHFMKAQTSAAHRMADYREARAFEDALIFTSPVLERVRTEPVDLPVRGQWFYPDNLSGSRTVLYLHGGGFTFYIKTHQALIAQVALAAQARTFALDYPLIPEESFPAQLDAAVAAYAWLLESGVRPEQLVIAGDSAGGNLSITLLLALKARGLPLPALAVCLCPWTDLSNPGESMRTNAANDWIEPVMARHWADLYCKNSDPNNPLVSPAQADLRGLPLVYIQAGSAEILYDMICAFASRAAQQGAPVQLEVWQNMPHDFQAFGDLLPESQQALRRIGEVIREHTR